MTVEEKINQMTEVIRIHKDKEKQRKELLIQLDELVDRIKEKDSHIDDLTRGANILGTVADETTDNMLKNITDVINNALGEMFKEDKRRITINKTMYRDRYPWFVVELTTETGEVRTFKQSGSGLAQVISFLFTVCLIDARNGRKIVVIDEVLNGLHPSAKETIAHLITVLSKNFQFVLVEYNLTVGKEYEVLKQGIVANVQEYKGENGYYKDLVHLLEEEME